MLRHFSLRAFCALVAMLIPLLAHGADKIWTADFFSGDFNGNFADGFHWLGGVPGAADTANFPPDPFAPPYIVTFANPLANPVLNQALNHSAGTNTINASALESLTIGASMLLGGLVMLLMRRRFGGPRFVQ